MSAPRRKNAIFGQFAARLIEMMESPAYRVLSLSAHRVLSRIEVEYAHHGGQSTASSRSRSTTSLTTGCTAQRLDQRSMRLKRSGSSRLRNVGRERSRQNIGVRTSSASRRARRTGNAMERMIGAGSQRWKRHTRPPPAPVGAPGKSKSRQSEKRTTGSTENVPKRQLASTESVPP
jgi:hypothetical protein